ncbi:MAG: hypothetical protein KDD70_17320, partial [Bdellovibrionales bacterium]|nr:hypothetical protein [Bdellovibrionales bacterium]
MRRGSLALYAVFSLLVLPVAALDAIADGKAKSNQFWWPDKLDLEPLRQHGAESNPMGDRFN